MGTGYWIIVGYGLGDGLNLNGGKLYSEGGENWWPCQYEDTLDDAFLLERHPGLSEYKVYFAVRQA